MKNPRFSIAKTFCRKETKHWKGIFKKYTKSTDLFIKTFGDQYEYADAPYWNIERTNVGMLATACWQYGWIALEEFTTVKANKLDVVDEESTSTGRCDLWISSKKGSKNYAIEAKKGYCRLQSDDITKKLDDILDLACKDAKKLIDEGDKHMGVAFMHIIINKKAGDEHKITNKARKKIKKYFKSSDPELEFIYLYLKDNGVKSEGSIIPGVVIAGKMVKS